MSAVASPAWLDPFLADWRPGTGPSAQAADAVSRAVVCIARAKAALNDAAQAQRRTR